ncbi:hypothetical protein OROMI_016880 [Orobanche minor]
MELNWHPLWTINRIKWPFNSTTDRAYSKNILFPLMIERGIIPTQVEINTRAHILKNLRLVVDNWIGVVGNRQGVKNLTALVVPYGSFGLEFTYMAVIKNGTKSEVQSNSSSGGCIGGIVARSSKKVKAKESITVGVAQLEKIRLEEQQKST